LETAVNVGFSCNITFYNWIGDLLD
jgi:hypothetical protein